MEKREYQLIVEVNEYYSIKVFWQLVIQKKYVYDVYYTRVFSVKDESGKVGFLHLNPTGF